MYSGLRPQPRSLLPAPVPTRSAPPGFPRRPSLPNLHCGGPGGVPAKPSSRVGWGERPGHAGPQPPRPASRRPPAPSPAPAEMAKPRPALWHGASPRRPPVPGASAGAEESPRGGAAPPRALLAAFQINFQRRPPEPQPRAAASLTRLPYLPGELAARTERDQLRPGRRRPSRLRGAAGAPGKEPAPRRAVRLGRGRGRRPSRDVRPPSRSSRRREGRRFSELGRPSGGPGPGCGSGPVCLGGSGLRAGRRLRARRRAGGELGEGAGARPAEGPPRSRSEPAARPLPGAPHGPGDLPAAKFPPSTRNRLLGARGPAPGSPRHRSAGRTPQERKLHSPPPGLASAWRPLAAWFPPMTSQLSKPRLVTRRAPRVLKLGWNPAHLLGKGVQMPWGP